MADLLLGDALELLVDHRGKTPKKLGGDFQDAGIPVASAVNVKAGRLVLPTDGRCIPESMYQRWMSEPVRSGDVLLTSEAPLGEVARILTDDPVALGQRLFGLRGKAGLLDNRYLYYALQWAPVKSQLLARATGTTVHGIRQSELVQVSIPVPELPQQERIAGVLGSLDDKIDSNAQIASRVLQLAVALYSQAVEESSTSVMLRDVGRWLSGGTPSTSNASYWGGSWPWISAASLKSFFVATSDRTLTDEGTRSGTRLVPPGAVLFVVRGMSLKSELRMGVAQREVAFGQDCKAILVHEHLPSTTVAVALLAARDAVLTLVDEAGHGTGRLPTDRVEQLQVRLPAAPSMGHVEHALLGLVRRGAAAEEETRRLTAMREILLPALMSGELRVRDGQAVAGDVR